MWLPDVVTRDWKNFHQALCHIEVTMPVIKELKNGIEWRYKKAKLVDLWFDWPKRDIFDRVINEPHPAAVSATRDFNMWMPLPITAESALAYIARRGLTDEQCMENLRPWLEHSFYVLANGVPRDFYYMQNWVSYILQNKKKTGVGLVLMSQHGAGKSLFFEALGEIFGPNHCCTISKPEELLGTFNSHLAFKLLVTSEEAFFGGSKQSAGPLKHVLTSDEFLVRAMRTGHYACKSLHNFAFLANDSHALQIDATERRFACFGCNNVYSGIQTKEARHYFDLLRSVSPYLIAWWYYTKMGPIGDWNPRTEIPVTDVTADQKMQSLDTVGRHILEMLQTMTGPQWRDYALMAFDARYGIYNKWCVTQSITGYRMLSIQAFSTACKNLLRMHRSTVHIGGSTHRLRSLHPDLILQKANFANFMQLPIFPELGALQPQEEVQDTVNPTDEEPMPDLLAVLSEVGRSPEDVTSDLERLASHWRSVRMTKSSCPAGCNGKHSAYLKRLDDGSLVGSPFPGPACKLWHEFDSTGGPTAEELGAPLQPWHSS
jgi:hypothetical protein